MIRVVRVGAMSTRRGLLNNLCLGAGVGVNLYGAYFMLAFQGHLPRDYLPGNLMGREERGGADVSSRVGAGVGGDGPEVGVGGADGGSADAKNATPPPPKRGWWGTRRSRDTDRPPDEKL